MPPSSFASRARRSARTSSAVVLPFAFSVMLSLSACGDSTSPKNGDATEQPQLPTPPRVEPPPVPVTTPGLGATEYVPLYGAGQQVFEQIQYTESDGTRVTLAGFRPTNRHARERGEPWESPDVGPGNYFTFPTWYFQNRTFGLMIRDEVPAGRSRVEVSLRVNAGTFVNTGLSAFRRVDANIRDYGWMMNVGFTNPNEGGANTCHSTSARTDCMVVIRDNWRGPKPGTPFKVGDVIELAPAPFLVHTPDNRAVIDGGGSRYYSFEQLYQVGVGMRPWYGIAPILDAAPLPAHTLSGGEASVSYNYSEEPHRVFQQMANNIGIANTQRFVEGRRLFHISFADGKHSESPNVNPVFTEHANQLGPRYNNVSCISCHALNGRSPVAAPGARLDAMAIEVAASSSSTQVVPDATYGLNVQQRGVEAGATDHAVSIPSHEEHVHTLPDGETVSLRKPVYAFTGPVPAQLSVRQAPQVIGMGLLEAVDESTVLALADPTDRDGDGVRGLPNWVINPETGSRHLGRFGWKASKATLRQQSADALLKDMGITSPVFKTLDCQRGVPGCNTTSAATEISETELERLSSYLALLGVPAQRSLRSAFLDGIRVSPEHDVDPVRIQRGATLFAQARCTHCHTATLTTGAHHPFAELRNQTIHPYTDLLLHDMGPGLADTLTQGQAGPRQWRTAPLWGLGSLESVQGGAQNVRYLHDGRARTLMEAIAWHGGEADSSRTQFEALSADERGAVLTFLKSL
ncbi:c-type cytochrome [Myxococcus sp. K38C18041901]|uniref:di-heme oxidoreductase family protein n=1 Tax=Myxococcus guangdongensis TaxID=2906760 RepID=UPI0020A73B65|nr:di-heme oxidoredictase family protein [Myxococcus guangdongensis]MCP3061554.1 c-type cytochrome [Myxococcus guangdongensis]